MGGEKSEATKRWRENTNLILNSVDLRQGARLQIASFTHTLPKQGA